MARTAFATDNALTKKHYEEKLYRDSRKETYFERFKGESADSLIQTQTRLQKDKGDKVTFGIRMRLSGSGVTGNTILEGNEEALTTYDYSVSLEQHRHGVRDDGALTRQRAMFEIDVESESALRTWAAEKHDQLAFDALGIGSGASTDPTKVFYRNSSGVVAAGSASTAKAALDATNSKLTPTLISAIKAWAKTGGGRTYVPIRPVKVGGKSYYILLVHPDCMYDLKIDSTFSQAMREAEVRGPENPIFQGATAIWDGVVIHEHENCATASDGGGSTVDWAKGAFMGAQALVEASCEPGEIVQEKFDYQNQHGFAYSTICAYGAPQFNSLSYGSVGVWLARTDISGL